VSLLLQLFVPFVWAFTIESRVNRGAGLPTLAVPAMFSPVMVAGIVGAGQTQMTRMMAIPGAPAWVPVWAPCVALHVTMSLMLVGGTSLLLRREARGSRSGAGTGAGTGAVSSQPVGAASSQPVGAASSHPANAVSSQPVGPAGTLLQLAVLEEPLGVEGATLRPPPLPAGVGRSIESAQRGTSVRTVSDNPVLWRELQRPLMPSRLQRFLGLSAAVVLMLISYWSIGRHLDDSDMQIGYAFVFNFLAMLLACVVSATAIAQEKESDTWTLLLTTPLSGWQIVRGKALGLLKRFIWPTVFVAAHFAIFTAFGVLSVWVCLGILWILLTFNLIWIATGIYLSLRVKKSTFAVILNLLLPVAAYLLTFLVAVTLGSLAGGREGNWIGWILYYLPYFYLATAIEKLDNSSSYLPYLRDVDHMTFAVVTLIVGVLHVILSWFILRYTGLRFDRIVGRAGGSPNDQDPMTNKIPMTNAQ